MRDSGADRHFLCLTPGQSLHRTIQQVIDLQPGTGVTSAPLRLRLPNPRQSELQRDVLHHRQLGQQAAGGKLVDEPHRAGAPLTTLPGGQLVQCGA